jgi:hypothetical protein
MIWERGCRIKINVSLVRKILFLFNRNIKIKYGLFFNIIHFKFIKRWRMGVMRRRRIKIRNDDIDELNYLF